MAAEKLYELHVADRFDLVVVDTPPTRQALDFLDAPGQLKRFLDHRVYRLMTSGKRGMTGVLNRAGFVVLRTAGRLVGAPVMEDAIAFFTAFEGMEAGFRQCCRSRCTACCAATVFVVLTGPQLDTVTEAAFFLRRLRAEGLETAAVVAATGSHPASSRTRRRWPGCANGGGPDRPPGEGEGEGEAEGGAGAAAGLAALAAAVLDQHDLADDEDAILAQLSIAPSARVPLLDHDIHDLDGLDDLRRLLFEV